jgi:hypothetical protein
LESWTRVHPDAEVILFGDDEGAADTARKLKIRHEPHVERSAYGTKRLDYLFSTARALARHDVLCYVNCDIVLMQDFRRAVARVQEAHKEFLMVGRRWDLEVWEPLDFLQANWQSRLEAAGRLRGRQRTPEWVELFRVHPGRVWSERAAASCGPGALGQLAALEGVRKRSARGGRFQRDHGAASES